MANEEPSIEELVARLRAGDAAAREILLCKYLPHLERILTIQMQERGIELTGDVRDLCQSTARRFLRQGERFHFSSADEFFACLLRIGQNVMRQRMARTRRERARRERWDGRQWEQIADRAPGPERQVAARQQWARIDSVLDEGQRVIVQQRAAQRSWQEIGAQLGISAAAARQRWRRLVKRLRRKPR